MSNHPAQDKLNALGIDAICQRIEAGETYREIAASLGIAVSILARWLNSSDHRREQSARALENSAESWSDRGLHALTEASDTESKRDPSVARAIDQHCRWRAAIRNPKYSERTRTDLAVSGGLSLNINTGDDAGD